MTIAIAFPAGWSATVDSGLQEEVYVLDDHLENDGRRLERDGYFRVPASSHCWTSTAGGVALVFSNVSSVDDDADFVAIDTVSMPWDASGVPPELDFMRIARKALFVDRDTGRHRAWLLSTAPQIAPLGASLAVETHTGAEEVLMPSGDITGPQGAMTPDAYFWRPRDTFHEPFGSRNGGLALSRFRHGVQDTMFNDLSKPFSFDAPYAPDLPAGIAGLASAPERTARY